MNKSKELRKSISKRTLDVLFTPNGGRLPILCAVTAIMLWLCASLGVKAVIKALPFAVPWPIADILHLGAVLPLGVGTVRYIAGMPDSGAAEIFAPFESVTAYTDAWLTALKLPLVIVKHPSLAALNVTAVWQIIPTLLSAGLWLFWALPYGITLNSLYLREYEKDKKINIINTNGETNQWTTRNSI